MIVYGMAASESVPRLYAAGFIPGLLIAALVAIYVVWFARRHGIGAGEAFDLKVFLRATGRGVWALGAPVIILGGIYGGVFSPTEAAAVACVYAAFVTCLVYRELGWRDILEAAGNTVMFTGQVLIIVACASVFAWLLTVNQVPDTMVEWLQALHVPTWGLLLAVNVGLLLVGCFLDPLSAILMLSPLLVPIMKAAGVDTVHFGIIFMVNLAIGLFHPPFGINIFIAQSVLKIELGVLYRGIIPFLLLYLACAGLDHLRADHFADRREMVFGFLIDSEEKDDEDPASNHRRGGHHALFAGPAARYRPAVHDEALHPDHQRRRARVDERCSRRTSRSAAAGASRWRSIRPTSSDSCRPPSRASSWARSNSPRPRSDS